MPEETNAIRSTTERNVVRVFISSTFRDMHAERDHLVTVVFPELRERIERLGLEFFDVDLRWGVPAKDANGETANSWEYCRQWIDRVEPFFVCILGQRYGWEPEPEQLKDPADRQRQHEQRRSITDMEVRHGVLDTGLSRRSYFYLRAGEAPASASEFVDPPPLFDKLRELKDEIRSCSRPVRDYPCRWTGEGFAEMEQFGQLVLDDLWSGVMRDPRFVSKDVWRQVLGADPDTDPLYTNESQPVPRELWEKIVARARPEPKKPLDAEFQQMNVFAAARLRWFQGRTHEIQQLSEFLDSTAADAPHLAVVAAVPGQGKSALLAKLCEQLKPSQRFVIAHFVGATERSSSVHALVQRLLDELDRSGISWPEEHRKGRQPKEDFNSLCLRLALMLGDYAGKRRIVILLDALNQLSDGHDLRWLPTRLGPNVRVVVSCVADTAAKADSPEEQVRQALSLRYPKLLRVQLGPLSDADVQTIATSYLKEYCHELDREHLDTLCAIPQARNPLYLLVMLNELRTLSGNDLNRIVPALIASMPQDHPDTVSLFRWVLQRLEVFGQEAVQWWCLYLAYGRAGMSSQELAELLARKLGSGSATTALLIERGLRRYLQRRGLQLDFFHGQLRQAVFEQYGSKAENTALHSDIAICFRESADPANDRTWTGDEPRPFLELVYHLAGAQHLEELCQMLCDLRFVEARCRHNQLFELIADYRQTQEHLPETQDELRRDQERQARLNRWTQELTAYACRWSNRRNQALRGEAVKELEPNLPEPPATCRRWTEEEVEAECQRILDHPNRLDQLTAFSEFVTSQYHALSEHGNLPAFVFQHARNHAPKGPVHDAGEMLLRGVATPLLLRRWPSDASFNPRPSLLRTLKGHSGGIVCISVTPNGRLAVSGSKDKTLRVWDLESGKCLNTLEGHNQLITCVSMSLDGRRVVSGSFDKTLRVWDFESGKCLSILEGHQDKVQCVSLTPDGRRAVSGSCDNSVQLWDLESGRSLCALEGHVKNVYCVAVTPDGRRAVSGSLDKSLRVWDLESGKCLCVLRGHSNAVNGVCVIADGRRVLSASGDKTLRVWDLESGKCLRRMKGHTDFAWSVSATPDGSRAVSGSDDGTFRIWDLTSGKSLGALKGHSASVASVSITPDGRRGITGSQDKTLGVWNLESGRNSGASEEGGDWIMGVSVTPDQGRAVSGSFDKMLRVWSLESGRSLHTLEGHRDKVRSVSVTPDGSRAVSASDDKTLRVWNLENGRYLATLKGHTNQVVCVSVTPDGNHAVSGSVDRTLRMWDLESGVCLHTLSGHLADVWSVSVTPDGRRAISGGCDKTLRVWNLESGTCLSTLAGHSDWITSTSVTPDGKLLISGSQDRTLRIWELESGKPLGIFVTSTPVQAIATYSHMILAGTQAGEVLILELKNLTLDIPVVNAARIWRFDKHSWDADITSHCRSCGSSFLPEETVLDIIDTFASDPQASKGTRLALPVKAWSDPHLLSECPRCQTPLRFNPFLIDNRSKNDTYLCPYCGAITSELTASGKERVFNLLVFIAVILLTLHSRWWLFLSIPVGLWVLRDILASHDKNIRECKTCNKFHGKDG